MVPHSQIPPVVEKDTGTWWYVLHTKVYRYRALLRKFWWVVLFTTCAGLVVSAWKVANLQVVYRSTARMMVSGKVQIQEGTSYAEETGNFMNTNRELMKDEQIRERAAKKVAAMFPEIPASGAALEVTPINGTSLFQLTAVGSEPRYPQRFLDAVMSEFIATRREMRNDKSQDVSASIEEAMAQVQADLRKEQDRLITFQRQHNVSFLEAAGNDAGEYLAQQKRQLAELRKEAQLLDMFDVEQRLDRGNRGEDPSRGDPRNSASSNEIEFLKLRQQLEAMRAERSSYEKTLRPAHPIMVDLDQNISRVEQLMETYRVQSAQDLERRRSAARIEIQNLEKIINDYETKALELSQKLADYRAIQLEIESKRSRLESLSRSKATLEISRNVDQEILSVRQKATVAEPIKPGVSRTLSTGVIMGLLGGILFLVLLDQMDDRVASFTEFQAHFDYRVLAQIPSVIQRVANTDVLPLGPGDERHNFVEAFRSLRSSILFMPVQGAAPKTLLVTSAVPNEGKSTVAVNLAITVALSGARVLLIDGDLRRGEIHRALGLNNDKGLGDVLNERMALRDAVQPSNIQGLWLLSRGNSVTNPGELFLNSSTDRLLKEVYAENDYIIFDSSPVMAADDTTSLAPKIDATIMVFRFTNSSARTTRKSIQMLQERQANIVGMVCNDVMENMQEYYYYRYPEYYSAGRAAN